MENRDPLQGQNGAEAARVRQFNITGELHVVWMGGT